MSDSVKGTGMEALERIRRAHDEAVMDGEAFGDFLGPNAAAYEAMAAVPALLAEVERLRKRDAEWNAVADKYHAEIERLRALSAPRVPRCTCTCPSPTFAGEPHEPSCELARAWPPNPVVTCLRDAAGLYNGNGVDAERRRAILNDLADKIEREGAPRVETDETPLTYEEAMADAREYAREHPEADAAHRARTGRGLGEIPARVETEPCGWMVESTHPEHSRQRKYYESEDEARHHGMLQNSYRPDAGDAWRSAVYALYRIPVATDADVGGWRAIESAPKDGTEVLVFDAPEMVDYDYDICLAIYDGEQWRAEHGQVYPTHWQPLPAPPIADVGGEKK